MELSLNDKERGLLVDTIDQAIEGHRESKELSTVDEVITSAEELVDHMHMVDENIDTLQDIKGRLL